MRGSNCHLGKSCLEHGDDLVLAVGRKVQQLRATVGSRLQAGQCAVGEVQRVSHAHKDEGGAGQGRPLKDGVEDVLVATVERVDLIEDQDTAARWGSQMPSNQEHREINTC